MSIQLSARPIHVRIYADAHLEVIPPPGDGDAWHLSREESQKFLEAITPETLSLYHFWLRPGADDVLHQFPPVVREHLLVH